MIEGGDKGVGVGREKVKEKEEKKTRSIGGAPDKDTKRTKRM